MIAIFQEIIDGFQVFFDIFTIFPDFVVGTVMFCIVFLFALGVKRIFF